MNTNDKLLTVLVLISLALILNIGYAYGDISAGIQGVRLENVTSLPAPHSSTHITIPFHPINSTSYSAAKSQATTPQYAQKVVKPVLGPEPYVSPRIVSVSPGGFDGIDASQSGGWTPPDVAMGSGPHHIVEMVNLAGQIYNKDGTPSASLFSLSSFFGTGVDSISDPRILYDSQSGRWFASILDITSSGVKIAVSSTNDPTGSWTIYNVPFSPSGTCPDQPRIGVSNDKFVVSANDFSNFCGAFGGTSSFLGADFFVFDKTELISGAISLTKFQHFGPDLTKSAITPVQSLSSTNPEYMVSVDGALSGNTKVHFFTLTGVPTVTHTGVTKSISDLAVRMITLPPGGLQPGTSTLVETDDDRVNDAKWANNKLWLALNDACLPNGDSLARSCVRLIQINTSGTPTILQDFDIGFNHQSLYYGAVSIEGSGTMDMISGYSSPSIFPSLLVTGQSSSAPHNTYQPPEVIVTGSVNDTDGRYGDYFSASQDILNNTVSWVAGEYVKNPPGSFSWSTFIANVTTRGTVISLNTNSGPVYTTVTVKGGFFDDNSLTTIKYNGITKDTQTTDSFGNFTSTFVIPSSTFGSHTITATDASTDTASSTFTVTPSISLNTNSGPVGASITVTGQGFAASSSTIIKYNSTTITTVMTNTTGGFTKTFSVPPSTLGAHPIVVLDAVLHTASSTFTVNQSTVSLNTNSGPVGASITVTGQGFAKSSSTIVKFHGVTRSVVATNTAGTFTTTFSVLSSSVGSNTVLATDASFNSGFTTFTVQPKIAITPTSGAVGTLITVTGNGFGVLNSTSIKYNGVTQTTVLTNGTGSFKTTFVTPSSATGSNVVSAIDASSHNNFTSFTTGTPTTVSLSDVVLQIWNLLNQVRDSIAGISANQMTLQTVKLASPITFDASFPSSKTVTLSCDKNFILQSFKLVTTHDNATDDFTIDANSILVRNTINFIHPALDPGANTDISNELTGLLGGPVGVNATDNFVVTVKQTAGGGAADTISNAEAIVLSSGASCTIS